MDEMEWNYPQGNHSTDQESTEKLLGVVETFVRMQVCVLQAYAFLKCLQLQLENLRIRVYE